MHQDATSYGGRPQSRGLCVGWGPSVSSPKRGRSPQIFGPCLLWPNGWMDQDGTWHGDRLQPRRLCFRWGGNPAPLLKKGAEAPPQFSAHFYSGETAGCIKMPLGMEAGLKKFSTQGTLCSMGTQPPPKRGRSHPQFLAHVYCGQTAASINMPLGTEVSLGPDDIVLDGDPAPPPQ